MKTERSGGSISDNDTKYRPSLVLFLGIKMLILDGLGHSFLAS